MTEKQSKCQFSMRSLLAGVAACAFALAFLHIAVFALSLVFVVLASRAAYKSAKNLRPRLGSLLTFIATWTVFYVLSIGPFIAISELEKKIWDSDHTGRLGRAYLPLVAIARLAPPVVEPFLWYAEKWIPPYATGLPVTTQGNRVSNRSSDAPPIGTWKNKAGNLFNFRPDGTARVRSSSDNQIRYIEWTLNSNEFAIYQYSSRYSDSAVAWFTRRVMMADTPTDRYSFVEISPTQFELRHASGTTDLFTAAQDAELELAP